MEDETERSGFARELHFAADIQKRCAADVAVRLDDADHARPVHDEQAAVAGVGDVDRLGKPGGNRNRSHLVRRGADRCAAEEQRECGNGDADRERWDIAGLRLARRRAAVDAHTVSPPCVFYPCD